MLNKIQESCRYVIENADYVTINYDILDQFIETIDCRELKYWLNGNPYNLFSLDISTIINFMLILESIDYSFFGNPKWQIKTEEGIKDGTDALLYSLLSYVKEHNSTDFSNLTFSEFQKILKGNVEIPLIKERYNTIVNISKIVNEQMEGNFYNYIKDIYDDRKLFDIIVSFFPFFKDERTYKGKTIYHYKLAQLLVSDIAHIRLKLENIKIDYSHLAGCPDYKIPQTMRALGIIEYNPELSEIIDNEKPLSINSPYEVEIRSSVIVVIEYIKNKIKEANYIDINDYFFVSSKKVKDKLLPYHKCRNTNY